MSLGLTLLLIIGAIGITVLAYFFKRNNHQKSERLAQKEKLQRIEEIETKAYPCFSNERAVTEMGVLQEVADTLLKELLLQINETLQICEEALQEDDIERLKNEIHRIAGSSRTLGSGGIASLLEDFFNYLVHVDTQDRDKDIIAAYLKVLKREQRFLLESIKVP